jgi:uncharacterized RDD family membrane protein YckC
MRRPRASVPAWALLLAGLIPALLSGLAWAGLLMTLSGAILLGQRPGRGTAAD